jgi:3-dehydroquinate synthase
MVIEDFSLLENEIAKIGASSIFIIADTNTLQYCVPILIANIDTLKEAQILEIEPGEESKSIEIASGLWESLIEQNADRKTLIINVGGGVVCDLGGFVAATYMRGISFINIPTSLLAMVDASIGGKTGVNLNQYKNSIGVFQEAKACFFYPEFLSTLSKNELRSGFAEIVKHYLLDSEDSFKKLMFIDPFEIEDWSEIIHENIAIKKRFVQDDLNEKGIRAALNLGHTVAHAIEAFYLDRGRPVLHGDAVAAGIIIEAHLAAFCNQILLSEIYFNQITSYITKIFPRIDFEISDIEELIRLMKHDKKNNQSNITFSLLTRPGNVLLNYEGTELEIVKSLTYYFENVSNA